MLFWLDFHQTQSNLYKWFRMQRHDWSSTSPKEPMLHLSISLHWLPVAARIKFKTLMLANRTTTGSALLPLTITNLHPPPEVWDLLVSDAFGTITERLKITLQNILIHHSWMMDNLPTPIRNAGSLSISRQQLKTHLFRQYLTSS